jgi:hypothetical protein
MKILDPPLKREDSASIGSELQGLPQCWSKAYVHRLELQFRVAGGRDFPQIFLFLSLSAVPSLGKGFDRRVPYLRKASSLRSFLSPVESVPFPPFLSLSPPISSSISLRCIIAWCLIPLTWKMLVTTSMLTISHHDCLQSIMRHDTYRCPHRL